MKYNLKEVFIMLQKNNGLVATFDNKKFTYNEQYGTLYDNDEDEIFTVTLEMLQGKPWEVPEPKFELMESSDSCMVCGTNENVKLFESMRGEINICVNCLEGIQEAWDMKERIKMINECNEYLKEFNIGVMPVAEWHKGLLDDTSNNNKERGNNVNDEN